MLVCLVVCCGTAVWCFVVYCENLFAYTVYGCLWVFACVLLAGSFGLIIVLVRLSLIYV